MSAPTWYVRADSCVLGFDSLLGFSLRYLSCRIERKGLLTLTVHSLLARTPPQILQEIILVDDNGSEEERKGYVDDEAEIHNLLALHPSKIKYIRNPHRLGCAGSRLAAIREATADVVVVIDSHVEMYSSTWAQHLLLPILENPKTLVMQTLDVMDDRPGYRRKKSLSHLQHWGFVNEKFLFTYVSNRFGDNGASSETPSTREPFEIPFAPGSLFAIRRDEFWRLGGYDQGLAVWGGENTELAMKVWRCGFNQPHEPPGRVVVVPCSRAGYVVPFWSVSIHGLQCMEKLWCSDRLFPCDLLFFSVFGSSFDIIQVTCTGYIQRKQDAGHPKFLRISRISTVCASLASGCIGKIERMNLRDWWHVTT